MTKEEIISLFSDFNAKTILLIGDGMVDAYMWGAINRQSPEAPVSVVDVSKQEKRLGGAANVAKNLNALGARTIFCGFVGDDDNGHVFKKLMTENGLELTGLFEIKGRPTTVKTRIIAQNKHVLRVDEETTEELGDYSGFISMLQNIIQGEKIDAILFQDYDKGVLSKKVINETIKLARQRSIPTIVDPKKRNFLSYTGVTLFKPNLKEIQEGTSSYFDVTDDEALAKNVADLRNKLSAEMVLLTLSEHGVYIQTEQDDDHQPAHKRTIVDVSGAGDTVVSVAALALAAGCKPATVAALANLAGGLVCEDVGVVPIDKNKLLNEALSVFV